MHKFDLLAWSLNTNYMHIAQSDARKCDVAGWLCLYGKSFAKSQGPQIDVYIYV